MPLAARRPTILLIATAVMVAKSAAAESGPTKKECIATSESAHDLRHSGKLRDARTQFAICNAASCPRPIREDCAQQLDEIATALPSITFEVKDATGRAAVDVTITMDGYPVAANASGSIELDPGEHTFTFEGHGLRKVEKHFVIAEGIKGRREVIVVDEVATPHKPTSRDGTSQPATTTRAPSTEAAQTGSNGPPTPAWVAFGIGGTGLVVGVAAGLVAGGKHSTLAGECDNSASTCQSRYAGDLDSFHTWRTISTVGYVVGAVGVASGVTLWLTAPKARSAKTVHAWFGPALAGIAGTF